MAQESIKGWGGVRDNQTGRPTKIPLGGGAPKTPAVRVGTDLLDALTQRYPDLKSDGERIRAAMWEAAGFMITEAQDLTHVQAIFNPSETATAEVLLNLLKEWGVEFDPTGAANLGTKLERAFYEHVNNSPELIERLRAEGYLIALQELAKAARERRVRGGKLLQRH